jgi:lysozyme
MKPRYQISRPGIELIKRFEGYRPAAAQLPDGRWTIGYGHTRTARKGAQVSESDAEALLIYDLIAVAHAVNEGTFAPLSQNQFDALCSFAFNIGVQNFRRSSVLLRLNEGAALQAACAMDLWRKADFEGERIVVDALVRRRAAEKVLFLTPPGDWPPAPTGALRPVLDHDAIGSVPRDTPAAVRADLRGDTLVLARESAPSQTPTAAEAGDLGPAKAAAAEVAARLKSLFPEPDGAAQPPASDISVAEEPFALTHPEEEVAPASTFGRRERPEERAPDLFDAQPRAANDMPGATDWPSRAAETGARGYESISTISSRADRAGRKMDLSALWGLGAAGFGLFLLGLITAFGDQGAAGGPSGLGVLGWLAGLVGVVLLSVAAYRLLHRLGRGPLGEGGTPKR